MIARRSALLSIAAFALAACSNGGATEAPSTAPRTILAQDQAWMRAVKKGDASSAAALYADSASLFAPKTDAIVGRGNVQSFLKSMSEVGLTEMRLTTVSVLASTSMARETGRYVAVFKSGNGSIQEAGKYVNVWTKQPDGSWKIETQIWNSGSGDVPASSNDKPSDSAKK